MVNPFARAPVTKYCQLAALNNRRLMSPSSGELVLEIKDPSKGFKKRIYSKPLSLACQWPSSTSVSSHHLPSMHICVQISSFYKNMSHIGLGPTLITSF